MRRPVPAPGSRVWIRERPWLVERAQLDRNVVRLDVAHRHDRLTFLAPYDRLTIADQSRRAVRVRPQHARARFAHALATTASLTTIVSARDARIDIWPHQLEAVMAVLAGHRRLLIADDVGLGKTIQAGLIITELARRVPACRALVIAPAGLCDQWEEELAAKFSIASQRADRDTFASPDETHAFGRNPWRRQGVWVASADYVKQPHVFQGQPLEPWDVVVIDEAHMATGRSDRHEACAELGRRARHLILLSATPHSGDESRFQRLLALGSLPFDEDELLVFRRTRASVTLPEQRHVRWHRVALPASVARLFDALHTFERMVLTHARTSHRDAALLLLSVLRKRALSTIDAFERTVARRLEWLVEPMHRYAFDWLQPSLNFGDDEDDVGEGERAGLIADVGVPTMQERTWLGRLRTLARESSTSDPKLMRVRALVSRTSEPVVVFTEFRHSLEAVQRVLQPVRQTAVLHGGQTVGERRAALRRFLDGDASVLITTDVGGQGLNLQARARWVINLELPWNPARLEQRIGRVDRMGQRRRVHFTIVVARHAFEEHLLSALARRALTAQRALGSTTLQDAAPPTPPALAAALLEGVALPPSPPGATPSIVTTRWARPARAMAQVLRRKRAWLCRWRGPVEQHGRPIASRRSPWRLNSPWWKPRVAPRPAMRPADQARRPKIPRVFEGGATPAGGMQRRSNAAGLSPRAVKGSNGGGTLLGYRVSLLDGSGAVAERHLVVLKVDAVCESTTLESSLATACEHEVERAIAARLRRAGRLAAERHGRRAQIEGAIAQHLYRIRRPEEAQLGLFSRGAARALDHTLSEAALADADVRARMSFDEHAARLSIARPELMWIWALRR